MAPFANYIKKYISCTVKRTVYFLLLLFGFTHVTFASPQHTQLVQKYKTYWDSESYKAKLNQKGILVVVKSEKLVHQNKISADDEKVKLLLFLGKGVIDVPYQYAQERSNNFSDIQKVSTYIDQAIHVKDKLFIKGKAFGYVAQMHLVFEKRVGDQINFKIVKGTFKGLEGVLLFEKRNTLTSTIQFFARYKYKTLPVPGFFANFALEVILQKMAAVMRSYYEKEFKKSSALTPINKLNENG